MNILFSIIMPAYNSSETIERAIRSVFNQSYTNWELVIVDDGSKDDTYAIANKMSEINSRIKVLQQSNSGPGIARNNAIDNATGDYIAFLDADDYWDESFLARVYERIRNNKSDVVFYDLICEDQFGKTIAVHKLSRFSKYNKDRIIRAQMTGILEWGMVKVIKRRIIHENKIMFSERSNGEEAIFSFDVLRNAKIIDFIDVPVYHYTYSSVGQHKNGGLDPWGETVSCMKQHLSDLGILQQYKKTVNSFALRSLCISCYRCSQGTFSHSIRLIKKTVAEYSKKYCFRELDYRSLDLMAKVIHLFIITGFYSPIVLASKIKR